MILFFVWFMMMGAMFLSRPSRTPMIEAQKPSRIQSNSNSNPENDDDQSTL